MVSDQVGMTAEDDDMETKTGKPFVDPVKCQEVE